MLNFKYIRQLNVLLANYTLVIYLIALDDFGSRVVGAVGGVKKLR